MDELLARIKNHGQQQGAQAPSESRSSSSQQAVPPHSLWVDQASPYASPPPRSTAGIAPMQPGVGAGDDRTKLLNLLRSSNTPGQQPSQSSPMANLQNVSADRHSSSHIPTIQSLQSREASQPRPLSAHDLMMNIQRKPSSQSSMAAAGAEKQEHVQSNKSQDILLNLFKKQPGTQPHPQAPSKQSTSVGSDAGSLTQNEASTQSRSQREPTPVRQFGSPVSGTTHFEAPQPSKTSKFNYVNPFDQLHSSSPLNRDRSPNPAAQTEPKKIEILKHNRDATSSSLGENTAPASKSRKLESDDAASAPTADIKSQSVSQALEGVGEQVDKQVEEALAAAGEPYTPKKSQPLAGGDVTNDATPIKKEQTSNDDVESSWESAEDEKKAESSVVEVYNFPLKPFVSVQIKPKTARPIRQENFMVIAQLKKEFDQIDRFLVTASKTHIVYAQPATKKDNGGLRIIRQDSGDHKQVYRSSGERVFSVQLCNADHDVETVLGTGVNGSIFWTSLSKSRGDVFADDDVEAMGFNMPAVQTAEENTSGSPVKTRAKMSCRHPNFFAIARGKQIYIIAPDTVKSSEYMDRTTRIVDSEHFFKDHTLKINTGKAGKDFAFSEDDSVIASLDKNGRFKFWDIRDLTSRAGDIRETKHEPIEMKDPLWTMNAATSGSKPEEKPSVSSIMFLDKDRAVNKGIALRYVLIGFKQNHILQLWDLGLGKAVQEIRLPHEKDSDGICSITYHPKSGIVAVGHPTRNSIYFIHLSAPKYNIPAMDQARYISMLARNDSTLPKPESTAIMSGLREFSFAKVGQLRSVDMLRQPVDTGAERNSADETMFELYVMHSKGVVGMSVKREDLGWDAQGKMVNPKDGEKEGVVAVTDLDTPQKVSSEQSSNADAAPKQAPKSAVANKKTDTPKAKSEAKKESASPAKVSNGIPRMTSPEPTKPLPQLPKNPPLMTPESYSLAAQRSASPKKEDSAAVATEQAIISPPKVAPAAPLTTSTTSDGLGPLLDKHFDSLTKRLDTKERVSEANFSAKQEALLRLVSSSLTENVDQSLTKIITARIENDVLPALSDITRKVVDRKIEELLPQQLNTSVAAALRATLSDSLQQALKDKEVHRTIAEITSTQVAGKVQAQVSQMLQQQLSGIVTQANQKMISDLEKNHKQQQRQAEEQRRQDSAKIDELSSIVRSLSLTMENMAAGQTAFQEQILRSQRENRSISSPSTSQPGNAAVEPDPIDADVESITQLLMSERFEEATIQWISSDRQAELFDKLFVRIQPSYLDRVSPLVKLTVSAAVTSSFDSYVPERLHWLGHIIGFIDVQDPDIMDVAPKIMDVLGQRMQGLYMQVSESDPVDHGTLRTIAAVNRQIKEIRRICQ